MSMDCCNVISMATVEPKLILLFSGKRKSGKDYVTDLIHKRLGPDVCCILRLSGPLKQQYAQVSRVVYSSATSSWSILGVQACVPANTTPNSDD
ncbi:unnamed protein product [Coregonus sp. 'balchen']|nr:unnamed protein product [Coregonus sp. 'balchen']